MASFSFNRSIKIGDIVYRQVSQNEWLNTKTNQRIPSSALSVLINSSRIKSTTPPVKKVKVESEYFYPRLVKISGIFYKQISPTQWQNAVTGQIFSNINNLLYLNILQTKKLSKPTPIPTPSEGPTGACCEIVNGVMVCSEKTEEACSGGCFKGAGTNCNVTDENPDACSSCIHCCKVGVGCYARTPAACLAGGGTYFGSNGCTACKFGVCSSDTTVTERFFGNGCTGIFIEGGGVASFDQGVFCTGSGVGQTCFGPGQRYQALTPNFIVGGTCSNCIFGACCTGGSCLGITSQAACSLVSGLFYGGQTCNACDFGVYCTGAGNDRTCIRTGYRGEALSSEFTVGATCSRCIMGTCCVNGDRQVGVRQSECAGIFFANIFNQNACDTGSCCVGATCNENTFRYNCTGVFNNGLTCIACSNGACCLPSGGCTLTTMGACMATGGIFFGGATCSACDTGVCCNNSECTDQRRGNFCTGTFYAGANCSSTPCEQGACCTGGNCVSNTEAINCANLNGEFFRGLTCIACATGANCFTDFEINGDRLCAPNVFFGTVTDGSFYENQGCSACQSGACCNQNGGGVLGIRGDCTSVGTTFFAGQTLYICDTGVFCTGSGVGQTCFGLGYRGQSLSNNFIAGATCNACILGACCTGGTCLSGGLTSQAACSSAGGLFFAGATCRQCDFGVYCTGATCLSLGFRGQSLSNNFIVGATCSSCILGACCTGGTCSGGGQTSQAACNGLFIAGATCRACDFGVYCTGATCFELGYRAQALTNNFIQGATCNSCILGACCTGGTCLGGGQTSQAACSIAGGTFYVGATCAQCVTGVFCTGSGVGQTCFGLGHRGQFLTNNFIAGATCSSCILGACCTGGTCLGGGLTSQAACSSVNGLFYPGTTCVSCDYGVYCTGSDENTSCLGLGYRAQNLSNQFVISGSCALDCVYGSCCQGTTCLGITKQANCNKPNAFFAGMTCGACDTGTGACCTGGSSSITTITGCNALGGIFFPEGTTALCVTGSCCTDGTCIQEIVGKSGSCELFIAGSTCGICDTGVFCTGATCLQVGFRGQNLATVFIIGQTCSSCIQGICCKDNYEYVEIAGGKEHSVALTNYGEVRAFGGNTYGQSGMTLALGYTGIAAGFYHTLAISNGGTVNAWGRNQYGQSTVPSGLTGVIQVAAGEYHSIALRSNGGVTCWGWNGQGQCNVPSGLTGVTMISAGGGHNLALKQDGTVVAWGYNYDGQTNVPAGLTGVIQVAAGYHHSLALLTGGGITCWGMTLYGQCNIPAGLTASKIAAGGYHTLVLKADGGVTAFGRTGYNQTIVPSGLNAKQIAGGEFHSLAINASNAVVTWGSNIYGQINVNPKTCESLNQKQCESKFGSFNPGATECSVCDIRVNCCINGVHSYVLADTCTSQGGIVFQGASDSLLCQSGAFCTGRTCAGVTLFGFNLGNTFIANGDCGDCIYGTCCSDDDEPSDTTQNNCLGTFTPGNYTPSICTAGLTYGICCNGSTCSSDILEQDCTGYFISDTVAQANSLSCGSNACESGICCGETGVTAATGGICLGLMTRAECALTGGDFFPSYMVSGEATGVTCSNCIYTPMLASVVTEKIAAGLGCKNCNNGRTTQFTGVITGFTGNEIQPRQETSDVKSTYLAYRDLVLYGVGATTSINTLTRNNSIGGSQVIQLIAENFDNSLGTGWKTWFSGATLHTAGITPGSSGFTGSYDYSPAFELGVTTAYGTIMGYIPGEVNDVTLKDVYEVPRYARLVFGYGNPSDNWHNTVLVYRAIAAWLSNNTENFIWSLNDATKHAQLNLNVHNIFPSIVPFQENNTDTEYSSPILVQFFPENPLKYRVRPVGSCCVGATCIGIVTKDHCITSGGTFTENGRCNRCYPNLVFGNCCVGGTHAGYTSLGACNALSGTFFEGTTYDAEACIYGIICTENKQCFQGISASYYGAFSSTNNKFFVEQEFGSTLGCLACDAGLCCVGATCMGRIPKTQCDALGGSLYYGETTCLTNCDLGICCEIGGACGTYTNRANCYGTNQVFVSGATAGATCSACSSLLTLTSSGSGVTYTMVLNKGTTHGTFHDGSYWVQETPNLKLLKIKMNYTDRENTTSFEYTANTKISGLTLNPSGYKGSVYVHGCAKNPVPLSYIDKDEGVIGDCALARADSSCIDKTDIAKTLQKFTSICYDDYSSGWMGPFGTDSTDIPANYDGFNLQGFLDTMNELKYNGMTLGASDVVMANTSNFDPRNSNVFPSNQTGYPYQIQTSRAQTLAYGILNCLSAADSTLAGSTLCFRPPNTWPKELQKPIYTISSINSKVPGTSGNPLVVLGTSTLDTNLPYKSEVAKTCAQASEFGDGTDYPVATPVWAMGGARTDTRSYGGQYIGHLRELLRAIHATGPSSSLRTLTFEQRRDGLARIVQYGIDAWGPTKMFCLNLFSGAAQKAGRTRAWIPLAGYYLGVSAMYDPELTLISDTDRTNHFTEYYYPSSPALTPGGTCATTADWRKFAFGDTGPNNNFKGIRRALARVMSHEVFTMVEYINDPSNLVRHYAYPGILYKDTIISGFGTGGQTGITFYNSLRGITYEQGMQADVGIYGNFGTIRWGDGTTSSNPYPTRFGSHFGEGESIEGMWLRVESGPGSSGPNGATASRYYRILYATGFEQGTPPEPANIGGGYQIVIGQTWADGIPNHTSVVKLYPLSVEDVGITRPSTFHPLGYTFGPVGFLIGHSPFSCNADNVYTETTLFDAQTASATPYFGTSLYAWADQYLLADYIRKTKGITLTSDIAPMPDYLRQFVYTSPYNIKSLYGHFSSTDSVFNTWLGVTWTDRNFAKNQINFAKHFPGVIQWFGLTV